MKLQHLTFILLCFCTLSVNGQESFERIYPVVEHSALGLDIQQTSDGGYLTSSTLINETAIRSHSIITKLSPKGDIIWSKNYQLDTQSLFSPQLQLIEKDTFILLSKEDESQQTILSKFSPDGNLIWSKSYGYDAANFSFPNNLDLISNKSTNGFGVFGSIIRDENIDLVVSFLDSLGHLEQGTIYTNSISNIAYVNTKKSADNGYLVIGQSSSEPNITSNFLFKIDSLKNDSWLKTYQSTNDPSTQYMRFSSVISTTDSGYLVVGDKNLLSVSRQVGTILKIDALGVPKWGKTIRLNSSSTNHTFFTDIVASTDGDFVISGYARQQPNMDFSFFMLKISPTGEIRWSKKYDTVDSLIYLDFISTQDNGCAYFTRKTLDNSSDDSKFPYLLKVNEDGISSCEDTLAFLTDTLLVEVDTLSFETESFNYMEDVLPTVSDFEGFQVPVLNLEVPLPFCEEEPIEWTFDATTPGAVSYSWSTGETADSIITVTEEDTYIVNVRIETDGCYNLCDTAVISTKFCPCPTDIPNVFTPNNDGANDSFGVIVQDGCTNSVTIRLMRIYNRWGQLVFETTTGQDWDGQFENKLAPSDVYIYYVEIENTTMEENGGIEVLKGDVTLVR